MALDPDAFEAALEAKAAAGGSAAWLVGVAQWSQLLLALAGVVLLAQAWRRRRAGECEAPPGPPEPAWGIVGAIAMVILFLPAVLGGALGARALFGDASDPFLRSELFVSMIGGAALGPVAVAVALLSGARGLGGIGLGPARAARGSLATGLRVFVMGFPVFTAAHIASAYVFRWAGLPKEPNPALDRYVLGESTLELGSILVYAVLVAPLCEELVFRGILFPAFRRRLGFRGGAALTAVFFALVHPAMDRAAIFVLALFLASAYERAGSLRAAIVAHAANNAFAMVVLTLQRIAYRS